MGAIAADNRFQQMCEQAALNALEVYSPSARLVDINKAFQLLSLAGWHSVSEWLLPLFWGIRAQFVSRCWHRIVLLVIRPLCLEPLHQA